MTTHDRADYSALGDRMALLTALRLGMAVVVVAWAAVRPEVLGVPLAVARRRRGRLRRAGARRRAGQARPRPPRPHRHRPDAPRRRHRPRLRDVRDGRDAEPDAVPHLPPSRRGLAALLVPDRPEGRALGLAPAVRRALRPGRRARPGGRRPARPDDRVRPDAGPQRHVVLAVRARDVGVLGDERARAPPAPGRPRDARRARARSSTTCPIRSSSRRSSSTASPPGSASSEASSSERPRAASSSSPRSASTTPRRPRPIPTRSSPSRGRARTSCRSAGSTRSATRCSTTLLPGARNVLVSPLVADGRPLGAVVIEYRPRPVLGGVERRVASVLDAALRRSRR